MVQQILWNPVSKNYDLQWSSTGDILSTLPGIFFLEESLSAAPSGGYSSFRDLWVNGI